MADENITGKRIKDLCRQKGITVRELAMTIDEIIEGLRFTVAMFTFDPMTGETVEIPARKAVKFKAAADLKRMFN